MRGTTPARAVRTGELLRVSCSSCCSLYGAPFSPSVQCAGLEPLLLSLALNTASTASLVASPLTSATASVKCAQLGHSWVVLLQRSAPAVALVPTLQTTGCLSARCAGWAKCSLRRARQAVWAVQRVATPTAKAQSTARVVLAVPSVAQKARRHARSAPWQPTPPLA